MISVEFENDKQLQDTSKKASMIENIIKAGYSCLDLIYYFTASEKEVRAWTIRNGTKAPQASAVIHTDFEKGFQGIEVIKFEDFKALGKDGPTKYKPKIKTFGKDYIVQDGDICVFKINQKNIKK